MIYCKNCNHEVDQKYCPNCGQAAALKRIDGHYIQHEIEHILHFERGILYTIRELLIRPGQTIRKFISEDRSRLVKPLIFILVSSLIYTVIIHFFHINDVYVKLDVSEDSKADAVNGWIQNHYGYANIIMGVFIAGWLKIFFKKNAYNFFEIIILLCFIMGQGMLLMAVFAIFEGLLKIQLMQISGAVFMVYAVWAIGQFFNQKKIASYLKAFAAYVLGMVSFALCALLLGFLVQLVIKH